MNKADPLLASLRQHAAGNAASRAGHHSAVIAKDSKHKVEHFREQLRLIAQEAKHAPQSDIERAETDLTQGLEVLDKIAEVTDHATTRPKARAGQSNESPPHQAAREITSLPPEWRAPEAALSSMMSRLDQTQALPPQDDGAITRVAQPQINIDQATMPSNPGEPIKSTKADVLPEQRFALSVDAVETRMPPAVKVVVREQETHFEPVPQLPLLQKIVDHLATDLPAAPAQAGATSADVALPDIHRAADKPVKVLTLQLEPPSIGTVTVRMRLAGDAVEIHLSADRYETTQMLRQDREALTDLMQSAGYTFEIASIDHSRTSDANPAAGQSQMQSEQPQLQQPQSGSQIDSGTGASERQSNDSQGGTRHNRQGHDQLTERTERNKDQEVAINRNGGALYL